MITKNLITELETLLSVDLDSTLFPYQKGKSIRIGHVVIRESQDSYKVFDTSTNSMICQTFSKSSAVAVARNLAKGNVSVKEILLIDNTIKKNYIDCVYYKNTMNKTNNRAKKSIIETRYEDAKSKTEVARQRLDKYIFE